MVHANHSANTASLSYHWVRISEFINNIRKQRIWTRNRYLACVNKQRRLKTRRKTAPAIKHPFKFRWMHWTNVYYRFLHFVTLFLHVWKARVGNFTTQMMRGMFCDCECFHSFISSVSCMAFVMVVLLLSQYHWFSQFIWLSCVWLKIEPTPYHLKPPNNSRQFKWMIMLFATELCTYRRKQR